MSHDTSVPVTVRPSEKELRQRYNLKKDSNYQQLWMIIGLLLFGVVLMITRKYTGIDLKDGIETFVAVAVSVIAYAQWRAARHEISIDKYYDRLDNANNRLEKLKDIDIVAMHVFAEMDKLEYVLMKYKIGFMPIDLVFRAIENFKSLCKYRNNFHDCTTSYIDKAAYLPETQALIIKILQENLPGTNVKERCNDEGQK